MRVLLLQLKRIGDLVLTAPAIEAIRAGLPGSEITLVTSGAAGGIVPCLGGVSQHLPLGAGQGSGVWARVAGERWDLCLDFSETDRSAGLVLASGAWSRAGYVRPDMGWFRRLAINCPCDSPVRTRHTVDRHLDLVRVVGAPVPGEWEGCPGLIPGGMQLPEGMQGLVGERLGRGGMEGDCGYVVVHAGTARPEKEWLEERWAEVVKHLVGELGLAVVMTGGREEGERVVARRILSRLGGSERGRVVDLVGALDLVELAGVIAGASLLVGVDTAAAHLAAAWRRPVIVLYGPTNPYHWRPRHPGALVVLAGGCEGAEETFVPRHVRSAMGEVSTRAVIRAIDQLAGSGALQSGRA